MGVELRDLRQSSFLEIILGIFVSGVTFAISFLWRDVCTQWIKNQVPDPDEDEEDRKLAKHRNDLQFKMALYGTLVGAIVLTILIRLLFFIHHVAITSLENIQSKIIK
jgi:hypothetical protein